MTSGCIEPYDRKLKFFVGVSITRVKPLNERSRFLVKIDNANKLIGLHCHNEIENSLWMLESDLETVND
jgi:hypothetical protein